MRWGPIVKSINSNLNTPLNTLISGVQSTVTAISNIVSTINTNTARGAVKSVQRGTTTVASTTLPISAVNTAKSDVSVSGSIKEYQFHDSSSIVVRFTTGETSGTWQVIEYY